MFPRVFMILTATIGSSMTGCNLYSTPYTQVTNVPTDKQSEYQVITMDRNIGYLIDPRTESCLLVYANVGSTRVDCQKLKKNVPEAAPFIPWDSK
ncbi:MAG: hypothetical protein AAFV29_16030 [Myxococcota bacterium]